MNDAFQKSSGLPLYDTQISSHESAASASPKTVVINVLDLLAESPERKEAWFATFATAVADHHKVILAVPRHNPAMDELLELQLRHQLPKLPTAVTNALRHGADGHILVSYDELKAGPEGPLGQMATDIFVSAVTTLNDVPHALHISPLETDAPCRVKAALAGRAGFAAAAVPQGWLADGMNVR